MLSHDTLQRLRLRPYSFEVRPLQGERLLTNAVKKAREEAARHEKSVWEGLLAGMNTVYSDGWRVTITPSMAQATYIRYDSHEPVVIRHSGTLVADESPVLVNESTRRIIPTLQDRQNQAAADRQANASQVQGRLARMLGMEQDN